MATSPTEQQTPEWRPEFQSPRAAAWERARTRADELDRRIERLLPESERDLPRQLDDATGGARLLEHRDWEDRFVDALARHFPGLGPAIRAVAVHLDDIASRHDPDDPVADPCGLVRASPPDFRLHGCADPDDDDAV